MRVSRRISEWKWPYHSGNRSTDRKVQCPAFVIPECKAGYFVPHTRGGLSNCLYLELSAILTEMRCYLGRIKIRT